MLIYLAELYSGVTVTKTEAAPKYGIYPQVRSNSFRRSVGARTGDIKCGGGHSLTRGQGDR